MPEDSAKPNEGQQEPQGVQEQPQTGEGQKPQNQGSGCDCTKEVTKAVQSYQKLLSKRDNDIAALKEKVGSLEAALAEANARVEELGGKAKKVEELESALSEKEKALQRKSLIMEKFPHLAEFEAAGALPDAETPEQLEERLAKFNELISSKAEALAKAKMQGVFPDNKSTPSGDETQGLDPRMSEEKLIEIAMDAQSKGDDATYRKAMAILMAKE